MLKTLKSFHKTPILQSLKSHLTPPTVRSSSATLRFFRSASSSSIMGPFKYPEARKDETIVDEIHGKKIPDPYRWLEDPDSPETQKYVESQNAIVKPFLEEGGEWQKLNAKLTKFWNYEKYSCPTRHGDRYFFYKNTGLQNQNVLYVQTSLEAVPEVFLDPNTLSDDGTIALQGSVFSDDGKLFAYGLSESGSDWVKIKVKDVETGKDFPETLVHTKFVRCAWTLDNKGFFYPRYPKQGKADGVETDAMQNQKLYYHRVGDDQEKDVLIAEFPEEPNWRLMPEVSHCGKYLILYIMQGCKDMLLYFAKIDGVDIQGKQEFVKVVDKFEADFDYITNEGSVFSFRTNKNAKNYHVINIDFDNLAAEWKVLVPEHPKNVLDWCHCVDKDKIILGYIDDVKSVLRANSLVDGKEIFKFDIPIGTIMGFSGEKKYSEVFYHFVSFLTPGVIYKFDFAKPNEKPTLFREVKLENFDGSQYEVEQKFYKSKDGEKIPMFIIQKKSSGKDKRKGCLLYGYGGFNINIQPSFSVTGLVFIDSFDGVLAYPNIRGGGEYGERWHDGGRLLNKQNCFDDFQAAAEFLVAEGYTSPDKIAIQGGSNGGLLVGACINQRPELFGAAVAQVGVLDMLRFHKFTIGQAWQSDYGDIEDPKHFENLLKYSPLHNVRTPKSAKEQYPATMVLTASHDDRVSPLHSLKFVAALHEAVKGCEFQTNPLFLRVYSKAGHGFGKPTAKKIEEASDILAFLCKTLKLDLKA